MRQRLEVALRPEAVGLQVALGLHPLERAEVAVEARDRLAEALEVLEGARQSLPGILALQSEASVIGIYKGMPGYMETIRYLGDSGFDITGFYPVSRDRSLRLIEFDCVMINRAIAAN